MQGSESAARTAVDPGDEFENFFGPVTITITMTTRSYDQYKAGSRGRPRTASEEQGVRRGRGENYGAGVSNTGGRHGGVDDATSEADSGSVSRETTPAAGLPLLQSNKLLKKATEASTQRVRQEKTEAQQEDGDAKEKENATHNVSTEHTIKKHLVTFQVLQSKAEFEASEICTAHRPRLKGRRKQRCCTPSGSRCSRRCCDGRIRRQHRQLQQRQRRRRTRLKLTTCLFCHHLVCFVFLPHSLLHCASLFRILTVLQTLLCVLLDFT